MTAFQDTAAMPEPVATRRTQPSESPQQAQKSAAMRGQGATFAAKTILETHPVQTSAQAERGRPLGTRTHPNRSPRAKNARKGRVAGPHAIDTQGRDASDTTHSPRGEAGSHLTCDAHCATASGNPSAQAGSVDHPPCEPQRFGVDAANLPVQGCRETHGSCDGDDSRGRVTHETQRAVAPAVLELIQLGRMRRRWHKAEKSLILQGRAMLRGFTAGDKDEANRLYDLNAKGGDVPSAVMIGLAPFEQSRAIFEADRERFEKVMRKQAKALPVWKEWAEGVKGLGDLRLAVIVGECGDIGSYKSVSAVWKRMGLAVINGERQRKKASEEEALAHGYNPERRSVAYVMGTEIIKAQLRNVKDDDGKPVGETIAIGPYGQLYLDRKRFEMERGIAKAHAHNRAMRYMVKQVFKHLYLAWRRIPVSDAA